MEDASIQQQIACCAYSSAERKYINCHFGLMLMKNSTQHQYSIYACSLCQRKGGMQSMESLIEHYAHSHGLLLIDPHVSHLSPRSAPPAPPAPLEQTENRKLAETTKLRASTRMRAIPDCAICWDRIEKFGIILPCGHVHFVTLALKTLLFAQFVAARRQA